MAEPKTPVGWAIRISRILNAVLGEDHFPIVVAQVAKEISRQLYPDDPIMRVTGDSLRSFEGALVRARAGRKGWGILFNSDIASTGRINFTLAHEFGHYLLHRASYPDGFNCLTEDMVRWDTEYGRIAHQANVFASYLLMPLDDFRRQLSPRAAADFDALGGCADRYDVSLTAAALKWLSYTERRAVLVVSRDGYMLWAWSSKAAYRTGAFFKTASRPRPIPAMSLAARGRKGGTPEAASEFEEGTWFDREPCTELALFSDRYDFTISLLQLGTAPSRYDDDGDDSDLEELRGLDWT